MPVATNPASEDLAGLLKSLQDNLNQSSLDRERHRSETEDLRADQLVGMDPWIRKKEGDRTIQDSQTSESKNQPMIMTYSMGQFGLDFRVKVALLSALGGCTIRGGQRIQ